MHWLSIMGILLIAVGAFCTFWGAELRHRDKGGKTPAAVEESALSEDDQLIRAEHRQLLAQAKLIQEENTRLRAENSTLALKHKRSEEDVEVYKYRAHELQQELEAKGKAVSVAAPTNRAETALNDQKAATAQMRPTPTPAVDEAPVNDEGESEVEIIARLQALLANRDYVALEKAAADQVRMNPNWMTPYVYQGVACRHLGQRQRALQSFVYVVENGAGDPAYAQAERALKLMTTGIQDLVEKNDWEQLAKACEKNIQQEPEWTLPYYFAGLAYTHTGDKQKAIDYLTHFVTNSPDDPETARAERALRLLKTNILELQKQADYPALIRTCEREVAADPDWMTPYYLLGLAYAKLGNSAKARENLEIFIRRAADDPDYGNAQKLLDSLAP